MAEITIGNARFLADEKSLTISSVDHPESSLTLDEHGTKELIQFINSLSENDFNRRETFRVPLWDTCGLTAQICGKNRLLPVKPTDISVAGMFARFPEDDWVDLSVDEPVRVILEYEGEKQKLDAVVRWQTLEGYGLRFCDPFQRDLEELFPHLRPMVMELQRRWLARRKKREKRS